MFHIEHDLGWMEPVESEILRGVAGHDKFFFKKYETMYTTHVLRSACLKGVCSHNQTVTF